MNRRFLNLAVATAIVSLATAAVPAARGLPGGLGAAGRGATSSGAETQWVTFTAKDEGFSIEVPGEQQKGEKPGHYTFSTGLWSFSIMVETAGPDVRQIVNARDRVAAIKYLEGIRDTTIKVLEANVVTSLAGELNGYPSLRYALEAKAKLDGKNEVELTGTNLLVITDEHLYLVMTVAPKGMPAADAERFLESFHLLKADTDLAANHARPMPSSTNPAAVKLVAPMLAVARLIVVEKLNPMIDHVVQNAPAAEGLGSRWRSTNDGWQKARSSITSRIARMVDTYEQSGHIVQTLDSELGGLSASDAAALAATLEGAAGSAILRSQLSIVFVSQIMSGDPNGPKPGERASIEKMGALITVFNEQVGPAMPRDDGKHAADAETYLATPASQVFINLWHTVIGRATVQLEGAINVMLFDDRETIMREIEVAIAGVK